MKRNTWQNRFVCLGVGTLLVAAMALGGCGGTEPDGGETPITVTYRSGYTPERFDGNVTNTGSLLCDGVTLFENKLTLKSTEEGKAGHDVVVYTVEIDLNKADIRAGTYNNQTDQFNYRKAVPWQHATAWEKATGGKVYATVNADFFGEQCVNAFVKDGYIVKAGHTDKDNYDYENLASDVPASAPMLFGIKGNAAQIAPIIAYEGDITRPEVKRPLIQAKLTYAFTVEGQEGKLGLSMNVAPSADVLTLNTYRKSRVTNAVAVKVDVSGGYKNMAVLEKKVVTESEQFVPEEGNTGYLIALKSNTAAYD
ncbi:MAG: hypothetical protein K2H43_01125, partial [Clostridia bacterium]|nr:hypothetical protein [Clostridia bacterium]